MLSQNPSSSPHPGLYLQELLIWRKVSPGQLADITGIPTTEILEVIEKRRPVDSAISKGLATYFCNSSRFWLDLQKHYDHRDSDSSETPATETILLPAD